MNPRPCPTSLLDDLLNAVRDRYERFGLDEEGKARLLARLRNLARLDGEPLDYPEPDATTFPDRLPVAFAVCHPECGRVEFLVEGGTQVCQSCGGSMFRREAAWYEKE